MDEYSKKFFLNDTYLDKAEKRFEFLESAFQDLMERVHTRSSEDGIRNCLQFSMNQIQLHHITISHFIDIARYKHFHQESLENPLHMDKVAAYLVKWLVKIRPISWNMQSAEILKSVPYKRRYFVVYVGLHINELFSLAVAQSILDLFFSKELRGDLLYGLKYRSINESALIIIFRQQLLLKKPSVPA